MRKTGLTIITMLLALALLLPGLAAADGGYYEPLQPGAPYLASFAHNCTNTGKMLPETFNPNIRTYILTVASWVSRVKFTVSADSPQNVIRVNGEIVPQGGTSSIINMTNDPQQAIITVTAPDGQVTTYTIFLQRRPSERRTRVSAGFINSIYQDGGKWVIDADLVSVTYTPGTNISTFTNKTVEHYKYKPTDDCIYYAGDMEYAVRMRDMNEFLNHYTPGGLYRIVYIEDEIVAVMPYASDY